MSYQSAKNNFQENLNLIGPDPMRDPLNWNLNNGLINLTNSLKADVDGLDRQLKEILTLLRRR